MANVLLGATGSVAAIRVPELFAALTADGHAVKVVATDAALYFFDPKSLGDALVRNADEWRGERYQRGDAVLHIDLRKWAELFLIAPLDANTLAKLAVGLCDNCLTCVWRAWDVSRPVILAPAMNTLMWEHPFTRRHLRSLAADAGAGHIPGHLEGLPLIAQINDRSKTLHVVTPIEKELACGDVGVGGIAETATITVAVRDMLARTQPI
jgi:phosphopantothenoylcysteine decarboxylase